MAPWILMFLGCMLVTIVPAGIYVSTFSVFSLSILESLYLAGRRSISKQTDCKPTAHSIFLLDAHTTLQRVASIQKRQTKLNHNS